MNDIASASFPNQLLNPHFFAKLDGQIPWAAMKAKGRSMNITTPDILK
jgi:hypothetical protein